MMNRTQKAQSMFDRWINSFIYVMGTVSIFAGMALADPPPATKPSTRPATTQSAPQITVKLPDAKTLPSSPGFFILKAAVTVDKRKFTMAFGLFPPPNYFTSTDPFPVVVTLHNRGFEGNNGESLTGEGMPSLWVQDEWDSRGPGIDPTAEALVLRKSARFIGIAPQSPSKRYPLETPPMPQVISELATQVCKAYRTDEERVYLTGFSYGGTCTWLIAEQMPHRYAAIVPISSRATPNPLQTAQTLKDLPIYTGCGTEEWSTPFCQKMADALKTSSHPNFVFQIVPNGTHWSYPVIYTNPAFMDWLLAQRRKPAAAAPQPAQVPSIGKP